MTVRSRYTENALLIASAVGLVIIGLLAGIMIMLSLGPDEIADANTPVVVERVQLGKALSESGTDERPVESGDHSSMFKHAANLVKPAVVFIRVGIDPDGSIDSRFFDDSFQQSVGSGVLISDAGYIVTNDHVIEGSDRITVILHDKRELSAEIVGRDPSTDLAVIRVEDDDPFPVVTLGDSDQLEVGEWVLAVGNPFRLSSTVTAGIVSALGRQVDIIDGTFSIEDFIQTDAAINPGNSGGALVNLRGELVGINTAIATESGVNEGYGFAVPVNMVERVVVDLISYGEVKRGFLGVSIRPLSRELVERYGFNGVLLYSVLEGGAAEIAGLEEGDIILTIDGEEVSETNTLQAIVASRRPGDVLTVTYWRKGTTRETNVALKGTEDPNVYAWLNSGGDTEDDFEDPDPPSEIPEPDSPVYNLTELGLGLADITSAQSEQFVTAEGVYIAYVTKEDAASKAGIPRDVIITKLNDQRITDVLTLVSAVRAEKGKSVLIEATRRGGVKLFFRVSIPEER